MKGISFMLPMVIANGLILPIAFAFGSPHEQREGSLAWALHLISTGAAVQLFVAMLSGFIAFSIASHSALVPGLIGGILAQQLGAGFLGGIASGFLAGYVTNLLVTIRIPLPFFEGIKSMIILPFLTTIVVGLAVIYFISPPVSIAIKILSEWLPQMETANALLLGALLGGMMAFDLGGPVNKAAAIFALGLLSGETYAPMAAVMAAGMTPPLGIAVAMWLFKEHFDIEERKTAGTVFALGLAYITEGALPFAARDPLRTIPALVFGSTVTGAIAMLCGVELRVPHGGILAAVFPGAVKHLPLFLVAITTGTLVTAISIYFLRRKSAVLGRA